MKLTRIHSFLFALALAACGSDPPVDGVNGPGNSDNAPGHDGDNGGGEDNDSCKVDSDQVGKVGATATIGGETVTITSWIPKQGEQNEYIGFTAEFTGDIDSLTYIVKCGLDLFAGQGGSWSNPNGDSGPTAKAISHIDFCDWEPPPPCEGDECPCEGDECEPPPCEGADCPCEGDECEPPPCEGYDCPCEGDACEPPPCVGSDCADTETPPQ